MGQFLGPETFQKRQFLGPEIVKMCHQNFWGQKLTKWFSFWGQKLYFMGEWNYIIQRLILNMHKDHKQSGHLSTNLQAKKYIYPVF